MPKPPIVYAGALELVPQGVRPGFTVADQLTTVERKALQDAIRFYDANFNSPALVRAARRLGFRVATDGAR